jgi:hypothetical protein
MAVRVRVFTVVAPEVQAKLAELADEMRCPVSWILRNVVEEWSAGRLFTPSYRNPARRKSTRPPSQVAAG